jgi:two-component system, OmpR family, response regulator
MRVQQLVSPRSEFTVPASRLPDPGRPTLTPAALTSRCDVAILRWPAQTERRDQLEVEGRPRLLLVSRACGPPECVDELEDWVRAPIDSTEVEARVERLAHRARLRASRPRVESSGLVRVGDGSVDLSPVQLAVARVLIARIGRVVSADEIQRACRGAGASVHPKAVKAVIGRLRARLSEVGLALTNIRGRGYLLERRDPVQQFHQE